MVKKKKNSQWLGPLAMVKPKVIEVGESCGALPNHQKQVKKVFYVDYAKILSHVKFKKILVKSK